MPYKSIAELPKGVKGLPTEAQKQFLRVVNSALEGGDSEERAFKKAWGVIKKRFKKSASGAWVKMKEWRAFVPFAEREDGWFLFFPLGDVWHHREKVTFTKADAGEMIANFKEHNVPNYDLPINVLHRDELGIYGNIADLRLADGEVQWKPQWIESKLEELKSKGYRFASPEIWWRDYQSVDGKDYNNVAMGIAITPRPRLGRATAVFSDGEWWEHESEPPLDEITEMLADALKDLFADRETAKKAQKSRSAKYGIAILSQGHLTKPGKWGSLDDTQFGDPVNYRYPIHDAAHARNAASRFAQESDTGYKGRGVIAKRIESAKRKFKIGKFKKGDKMSDELEFNEELAQNIFERLWNKLTAKTEEGKHESDPNPEDFSKQLATLEEKLRTEFSEKMAEKETELQALDEAKEKAEKEAQEFSDKFAEEERQRRLAEFSETAKKLNVPVDAKEFGGILMLFHDADTSKDKAGYNKMVAVIEALGNAEKMASLFAESGSDAVGNDPVSKLDALIVERRKETKESLADATKWVAQNHPGVYAEYDKATVKALGTGAE